MKSWLFLLFLETLILSGYSQTGQKLLHNQAEEICIYADEFGVCRYKLSSTGNILVKLINEKPETSKSIMCFGGLCYRASETDCLPLSTPQKLDVAWYAITEKQTAELQLISCTDSTLKTIRVELIP